MIQRAVVYVALLVCAGCALRVETVTFPGTRTERFLYGVAYYQGLAGVERKLVFADGEFPNKPEYCAWVVRDPMQYGQTIVGLNTVSPRCRDYKPEWLALHEVCHLRMAHTNSPFDVSLSHEVKEREVAECMKGYDARRE